MVAATAGELSPVVTGIIYCSAIASCHRVFALDRVREWTAALSSWCDANPQLGMFTGYCLVHRAEVMEMSGSWPEAVDEARRAVQRCVRGVEREAAGRAHYQEAEIHRLRGEFELAETEYREASRSGFEPQPGTRAAAPGSGRHECGSDREPSHGRRYSRSTGAHSLPARARRHHACSGDLDAARTASHELTETAASLNTDVLAAIAAHARADRLTLPMAMLTQFSIRCVARSESGSRSARRISPHACACSWREPVRRWKMSRALNLSSNVHARSSKSSARGPTWPWSSP